MKIALLTVLAGTLAAADPFYNSPKPYEQTFLDNYNVLKYVGGQGPWTQRRGVGLNRDPPAGCKVDQAIMLHRHGERWPSGGLAKRQDKVWRKIAKKQGQLRGSLEFANYWIPYTGASNGMDGEETPFGPYAGLLTGYNRGVTLRIRYGDLYNGEVLPIFTSGYERVAETGRWFGRGFLGYNYTDLAAIQIIPEVAQQGANALAPVCEINPDTNCETPADSSTWIYPEFEQAAKRLNKENGLDLKAKDIPSLMSIPSFELNVRGSSPWIPVFTSEEWVAYEYLNSARFYCYSGPGAPSTLPSASLYLNATRLLLNQGPEEALPLYFSFVHDSNVTPVVAALGIASPSSFDPTKVHFYSEWDVSDIVPQGGHIILERLVCGDDSDLEADLDSQFPAAFNSTNGTATYASNYTYSNVTFPGTNGNGTNSSTAAELRKGTHPDRGNENIYVRVVLNEAVAPIPDCMDGPGKSCKLSDYNELIDKRFANVSFVKDCNVRKDRPQSLDFFWTWNSTNEFNADPEVIPYQATLLDWQGQVIS